MKRFRIFIPFLGSLLIFAPRSYAALRYDELLKLCEHFEPQALDYAKENGAEIVPVKDGRSFVLWWAPEHFDLNRDTVFVSLHGHGGWAPRDFQVWHPHLKGRGWAFLGIQWWYGRSMESFGYAQPGTIYKWIREALEARHIPPGHVIFTGFSMGGANSYAVTFFDRQASPPYFNVTISNAGAMEADFPPNRLFLELPEGSKPFAGMHWILYCAEHDEQREKSCEKMEWTKGKLTELGATVEQFIRDPVGGHGGFMSPDISGPALDLAERFIQKTPAASVKQ